MFHSPGLVFLVLINFAGVPQTGTKHSSRNFCSAGINSSKSTPKANGGFVDAGDGRNDASVEICSDLVSSDCHVAPLYLRGRTRGGEWCNNLEILATRGCIDFLKRD
jgi:hypothetical protein